jgi:hypothetical protein
MARSIEEIYNEMLAEKAEHSQLDSLTSTSQAAVWRGLFWVVAFGIYTLENIFDIHKQEVQVLSEQRIVGSLSWYRAQVLLFQHPASLAWNGEEFVYSVIDPAQRIVQWCSVVVSGKQITIKVAKDDGNGNPQGLTLNEKDAVIRYVNLIKIAGAQTTVITGDADLLKIIGAVYRDPNLINELGQDSEGDYVVISAINTYLKNLEFDGTFRLSDLVQQVKAVEGVIDFAVDTIYSKYGAYEYFEIAKIYQSFAGYMELDEAESLITYEV